MVFVRKGKLYDHILASKARKLATGFGYVNFKAFSGFIESFNLRQWINIQNFVARVKTLIRQLLNLGKMTHFLEC